MDFDHFGTWVWGYHTYKERVADLQLARGIFKDQKDELVSRRSSINIAEPGSRMVASELNGKISELEKKIDGIDNKLTIFAKIALKREEGIMLSTQRDALLRALPPRGFFGGGVETTPEIDAIKSRINSIKTELDAELGTSKM